MGLYKANPHFVESQVKSARAVLLNKCDKVDRRKAMLTRDAISAINPNATVITTEFGAVDWSQYQLALSTPLGTSAPRAEQTFVAGGWLDGETGLAAKPVHLHDEEDALGYESFGLVYDDLTFDETDLADFFRQLNASEMGEVVRAKGIFRVGNKSVLMELASGEFSSQPIREADQNKVSIIGRKLNRKEIGAALERCVKLES
jgi:G3E family GTPase